VVVVTTTDVAFVPFDAAERYRAKGWTGTLPLPAGKKFPPPSGFTGHNGHTPETDDLRRLRADGWQDREGNHYWPGNIGLRLAPNQIGLDVDGYAGKRGGETLAALEADLGLLPPTWRSTSRTDGISAIYHYRVPPGQPWPGVAGPDIEIVQRGHRYAVVAPSIHPTGQPYVWITPEGEITDEPPSPGQLPELPVAWRCHLLGTDTNGATVSAKPGTLSADREHRKAAREWITGLPDGVPCAFVGRLAADLYAAARREDGNAYDSTRDRVLAVLRAGETGHPGVPGVLTRGREVYVTTVAADRGGEAVAGGEWDRFTEGGGVLIARDPGTRAGHGCDCAGVSITSVDGLTDHGDHDDHNAETEHALAYNRDVQTEAHKLRVREAAARIVRQERTGAPVAPSAVRLDAFLAVPDEPTTYRVDRLWPVGGRIVIASQYKAGKSTMLGNLIRSLVDGVPFLGAFAVPEPAGVVLIDDELDERMLRRWLRDQGIVNTDRVHLFALRGRVGAFDLLDEATRADWAQRLRATGASVALLDCLRPVLDALGLDENRDAGRFLVAFDALLEQAGMAEAVVAHHMGHTGERSRGDSRILDWPDASWKLVRETDDPGSPRYLSAFGRDVDAPEGRLSYDEATRHLSFTGGNRRDSAADALVPDVVEALVTVPDGLSGRKVEVALTADGHSRNDVRQALKRAVSSGAIEMSPRSGRGGGHLYTASAPKCAEVRQRTSEKCATAPIGGALTAQYADQVTAPAAHYLEPAVADRCEICLADATACASLPGGRCCWRCTHGTTPPDLPPGGNDDYLPGTQPLCVRCGAPLLLIRPGRTVCGRCDPTPIQGPS